MQVISADGLYQVFAKIIRFGYTRTAGYEDHTSNCPTLPLHKSPQTLIHTCLAAANPGYNKSIYMPPLLLRTLLNYQNEVRNISKVMRTQWKFMYKRSEVKEEWVHSGGPSNPTPFRSDPGVKSNSESVQIDLYHSRFKSIHRAFHNITYSQEKIRHLLLMQFFKIIIWF